MPDQVVLLRLGRECFQATFPGNHISAGAKEALLSRARAEDARVVALLESVFVAMASCGHGSSCWRQSSVPVGGSAAELAPQNVVPVKEGWATVGRSPLAKLIVSPSWLDTFHATDNPSWNLPWSKWGHDFSMGTRVNRAWKLSVCFP